MFKPGSVEQLASVGDDQSLLFWDTRTAKGTPSLRVDDAHGKGEDVQCVDWATEVRETGLRWHCKGVKEDKLVVQGACLELNNMLTLYCSLSSHISNKGPLGGHRGGGWQRQDMGHEEDDG